MCALIHDIELACHVYLAIERFIYVKTSVYKSAFQLVLETEYKNSECFSINHVGICVLVCMCYHMYALYESISGILFRAFTANVYISVGRILKKIYIRISMILFFGCMRLATLSCY